MSNQLKNSKNPSVVNNSLEIQISKIKVEERIRKDPKDIDELAQSIKEDGLLCPIIVRKINEHYKLLAGWRRLEAHKKLELTSIAAIIKN